MINDQAIRRFKQRRAARLESKKQHRYDAVEEYRERRTMRMRSRMDAKGWEEPDHPRDENGRFTSGSGGSSTKREQKKPKDQNNGHQNNQHGKRSAGSHYTGSFRTPGGTEFPKPRNNAVYDEDTLNEVNRLSGGEQNDPAKGRAYEKVVKKLTPKDLTYQDDPDGTTVASIPGLSYRYDTKVKGKSEAVQAAYDQRIENGKKIVSDMISISDHLGSRMMGLENCFKGGESTARKIDKVKAKWKAKGEDLTDEQALDHMDDVVRFTYKCDHSKMAEQVRGLERALEEDGYEILERDNKFLPKEDGTPRDYKAVHLQVRSPDGEVFEIQIQSEETIKVKNRNHALYERSRQMPDGSPEKAELVQRMVDNWSGMNEPDGIQDLQSFRKKGSGNNAKGQGRGR